MKNKLIVKSNDLIEASYKLTLGEQRVIYILTSMINNNDEEFKPYRLTIKEFTEILGTKSKDMYSQVAKYIEGLRDRDLTITKKNSVLKTKWLSSAEYFIDEGYVELCFDPKLKPYLLLLKERFTKFSLNQIFYFKSQYSSRIYEILKQYEKIGKRECSIDKLKSLLGIGFDEYVQYGLFKQRVLLRAQKELKEKTDIEFEFEEIKTGRKVTSLKFYIKENVENKCENNFIEVENKIEEIKDKKEKDIVQNEEEKEIKIDVFEDKNIKYLYELFEEKISKKNIEKILLNAENNIEKVERIYNYSKTQNIENIVGFMLKMVKGDNFIEPVEDKKQIAFNDFTQRECDYDKLEKKLLGWDKDNQDENIQSNDDFKNNELEMNDIEHEEEKEEIIYRSEIDTKMFLEEQLKGIFGEVKYKTWLKYGVDNLDIDDKNIVHFYFTNSFALSMFERDYKDVLLELINSIEPLLKLNTVVK